MKKLVALLFAVVMCVSLIACDSEKQTGNSDSVKGQTSTVENESATEKTPEPAFDTSWAENDLQKLIPQPPFSGWTVTNSTDTVCEMECATGVTDTAVFYPTCEDYVDTLNSCGFTETDKSKDYLYEALDANGNKVEFKYGDCWCWITITAAE